MNLINYRHNYYSQNGEDGVLLELLRRLNLDDDPLVAVEFGAWNGIHLSNTFNLIKSHKFTAIYIEGDQDKFKALEETASKFEQVTPIQAMLSTSGQGNTKTLDHILGNLGVDEITVLSIDIDSNDLEIWASSNVLAKIVVIEINSSIEPGIVRWHNPPKNTGNSFSATLMVARAKGYTLVCHTGNMIFVRNDLVDGLNLDPLDLRYPERLFLPDWLGLRPSPKERALKMLTKLPTPIKTWIRKTLRLKEMNYSAG